jgi:hypothetical protein
LRLIHSISRSKFRALLACTLSLGLSIPLIAQQRSKPMTHHAHGTFTVKMEPKPSAPAEGLTVFTMNKQYHGDLNGSSKGEMISTGDYKLGAAGYVAIEQFTGNLDGKSGSFALAQLATMNAGSHSLQVVVVPGSGTGQLQGITGTLTIKIENGQHFYELDYSFPN